MKKLSFILITVVILLSFSNVVLAEDSISLSIVQKAQSVDVTAKYLKDGSCTGNISVSDGKQPPIYQKFSSLFFTTTGQSKTAPFDGLTKGTKYYVEASCSKTSGEAYSQKDSFIFGTPPVNGIVSITAIPTDKTVQVSFTYDIKAGPGIDNVSGVIKGDTVGMGGGMYTQTMTPTFNPSDGRIGATGKKTFTFDTISALTPETKYTVTITAKTGNIVKYVKSADFTTKKLVPVTTPPTGGGTGTGTGTGTQTGTDPVEVNPSQELTPSDNNTYNLLAPIGTIKQIKTSDGIGDYLNIIFKIIIGLCGALAVIMIVIGGIQYMGNESVFGKTEAKSRILSAILGLLIALGAYAILYTINPALTGQNGISIEEVDVQVDTREDNNYTMPQANKIISEATATKNVVIGRTGSGVISMPGVVNKIINVVEKPNLKAVRAIVVHWTGGSTALSAYATWIANNTDSIKKNDSGAHFIVDKDGTIWQTVGINMRANHFITDSGRQANAGIQKPYLSNYDTIGIEIVGTGGSDSQNPSQKQITATANLVKYLMSTLRLTSKDVYGHGQVGGNRSPQENLPMITAIKPLL